MVGSKKDTVKEHKGTLKSSVKPSPIKCPRCFSDFICNAADIEHCQCYGINLQSDDFAYLQQKGFTAEETGCLCRNCLLEIQKEVADAKLSMK